MQLLYPNNIKKYIGTIKTTRNGYKVKISTKNLKVASKANFPEPQRQFHSLIFVSGIITINQFEVVD